MIQLFTIFETFHGKGSCAKPHAFASSPQSPVRHLPQMHLPSHQDATHSHACACVWHVQAHMAGRKHRRRAEVAEGRVTRRSPHVCRLCDISTTSADHMALHIAGRAHQRRLRAEASGSINGAVNGGGVTAESQSSGAWDAPEEVGRDVLGVEASGAAWGEIFCGFLGLAST